MMYDVSLVSKKALSSCTANRAIVLKCAVWKRLLQCSNAFLAWYMCILSQRFMLKYLCRLLIAMYQVARASALQFNPDVSIIAYHDSIMK